MATTLDSHPSRRGSPWQYALVGVVVSVLLLSTLRLALPVATSAGLPTAGGPGIGGDPGLPTTIQGGQSASIPAPTTPSVEPCRAGGACERVHPASGGPYVTEWFNTTAYASVTPSAAPPSLIGSSMAYDPGNTAEGSIAGTVVLFGGLAPWGATNFTYVGIPATVPLPDGVPTSSVVWVNISAYLLHAPTPRYYASMTYDALDGYLLLFGGQYAGINASLGDTWTLSVVYQGETVNPPPAPPLFKFLLFGWTRAPDRASPSPRAGASLTYDPLDGYAVLFGGYNDPTFFGDTWTYAGGTWTQLHPSPSPSVRAYAGFVFDGADGYALLLPGLAGPPDQWGFVHGAWTKIAPSNPMGVRWGQGVAYNNATGNVSVFGGVNGSTMATYADTWNWSSPPPLWSEVDSYGPVPRGAVAMAYDPQIGCSVLFGGGTTGGGGWLDDTWLLCTWPLSEAPLTVTLIAQPGVSDRPEVHPGGNATFTAVPAGGTFPYFFEFNLSDAPGGPASQELEYRDASGNATFTFPDSANYFVSVRLTDTWGTTAHANLTYPVGTVMVTDWQPLRDSYNFHNFGSAWSTGGNCFGFSTTMILYWQHDIRGGADTPYLPASVWSTANLTEGAPVEPQDGPGMNGTTLAIMLHQTVVQGASHFGGGGGTAPSDFAANWAAIQSSLAAGQPLVMLMNAPKAGHAVVAYGEQALAGGVVEIDVSDPNAPQTTEHGFYNASNDSFWWTGPAPVPNFDQFGLLSTPIPLTLAPSMFSKWTLGSSGAYDTQSHGYYFVAGLAPLTIGLSGGGSDSFSDGGSLADSQTFVQGIANSSGVEEPSAAGTVQAYALENLTGNSYTVTDPASGSSPVLALLATNVSGTTMVRGFDLNLSSNGTHDFSLGLEPGGTDLKVGASAADVNVSFGQLVGNASDVLNATGLEFPADSQASFEVLDWAALASGTVPSVEVRVTTDNGSGPTTQYSLENGQSGLGPGQTVSYPVTFTESGLPTGTAWSATVNGPTTHGSGMTLVLNETNGSYAFSASSANRSWNSGGGSFVVDGQPVSVKVPFSLVAYPVGWTESGIPASLLAKDGWTVGLGGTVQHSTSPTITFLEPNGTYPALVSGPSGYAVTTTPTSNQTVAGAGWNLPAVFAKGKTLTLTVAEKRLPKGQNWCFELEGERACSTAASLKYLNLTPGKYGYAVASPLLGQTITVTVGHTPIPTPGTLPLAHSEKLTVTYTYEFTVTFNETGLPPGTQWSVTLGGLKESSTTGSIQFDRTNGTYGYVVGTVVEDNGSEYRAPGGKVTVQGEVVILTHFYWQRQGKAPARGPGPQGRSLLDPQLAFASRPTGASVRSATSRNFGPGPLKPGARGSVALS